MAHTRWAIVRIAQLAGAGTQKRAEPFRHQPWLALLGSSGGYFYCRQHARSGLQAIQPPGNQIVLLSKSAVIGYRPDIDGLRAIAILSVVAFHAGIPGAQSGFVGVDIFFVISGYLITGLLLDELSTTHRVHLGRFVARRIRRLLPPFACVLAATMLLAAISVFPNELPRMGKAAIAAATVSANFHFLAYAGGYFDPSTDLMPFLHTWSLAVEEQYYLIWPVLLMGVWLIAARLRKQELTWVAGALLLTGVISFVGNIVFIQQQQALVFYMMPFRAWEFSIGGLLVLARLRLEKQDPWLGEILFSLGFALLAYSIMGLDPQAAYPGWQALIPVIGSALVIAGGGNLQARLPGRILGNGVMIRIGLLSYSWYLWHWPLLALTRAHELGVRSWPRDLLVSALALLLAWLTYHLVEFPIRYKRPFGFKTTRTTIYSGVLVSLLLIALATGLIEFGKLQVLRLNEALGSSSNGDQFLGSQCQKTSSTENCTLGPMTAAPRVLAWGDSHIGHWHPLFEKEAARLGEKILLRVGFACPPLMDAVPYKQNRGNIECGRHNDQVIEEIRNDAAGGALVGVVLSARWNEYLARQETDPGAMSAMALADHWKDLGSRGEGALHVGVAPYDHPGAVRVFEASLARTIEELTRLRLRVLVIAPTPELYFNGPQCLYLRSEGDCVVPRSRVEERRLATMRVLTNAAAGHSNVRIYDPINEFCDANTCFAKRHGVSQYTDHNHVSPTKALATALALQPLVTWVSGGPMAADN